MIILDKLKYFLTRKCNCDKGTYVETEKFLSMVDVDTCMEFRRTRYICKICGETTSCIVSPQGKPSTYYLLKGQGEKLRNGEEVKLWGIRKI